MGAALATTSELQLRLYGSGWQPDADWLAGLEGVSSLSVDLPDLVSYEPFSEFTALRHLALGRTKSSKPSLDAFADAFNLGSLWVDGALKGVEVVQRFLSLETLRLRAPRVRTLDWLAGHPSVAKVELTLGSITDLEPLATLGQLRRVLIAMVRGLSDEHLGALGGKPLGMLAVNNQPRIGGLEPLGQADIVHLSLVEVSHLRTLRPLEHWPVLSMVGMSNAGPVDGDFGPLRRNRRIRHLAIGGRRIPHEELQHLAEAFEGRSLWYRGQQIRGAERPEGIIASRLSL